MLLAYSSFTAKAIFFTSFALAGAQLFKAALETLFSLQQPGIHAQQADFEVVLLATVLATAVEAAALGVQEVEATVEAAALGAQEEAFAVEATFLQSEGLQSFKLAVLQLVAFSPQKILHHSGEQQAGFV